MVMHTGATGPIEAARDIGDFINSSSCLENGY